MHEFSKSKVTTKILRSERSRRHRVREGNEVMEAEVEVMPAENCSKATENHKGNGKKSSVEFPEGIQPWQSLDVRAVKASSLLSS